MSNDEPNNYYITGFPPLYCKNTVLLYTIYNTKYIDCSRRIKVQYIYNLLTLRFNYYSATMADHEQSATSDGPHLEVLDRVKNIPAVHTAIEKTGSTYSYLKGSHHLINWALSYAEAGLCYATATAAPIAKPLAKKFEDQINTVDQKLCQGLNIVEQKVPIFKQPTQEVYDAARRVLNSSLQPTINKLLAAKESATQQANVIKKISVDKANELLSTHYGAMAIQGVDNTSTLVNNLLDHYFPPTEEEESKPAPVSADENKVLHAVQTIGQLSSKTANRVYHSVAAQLRTIKKEDVATYITSVVSILHLTHFLNLDKNTAAFSTPPEDTK
ncbi:Similar to Lsd-2: Lipid storage droplets surface-binding protein 2 (Drosophila melanogaster) [Cotesia congregata]|uniref:Similar to Lsd-2: Lipid storage droplets surface-binding protein 2 (Drosophila melanogaster) n=1 Tax=Cotesia congregata TaxID=51543 RepID=A0A8J2MGP7_COTCN|nr:Similar to Lsd-2: Lipid storage droplets surface-binding protein 2 (Drosophila melanogaster) [Cotesia congregata]